MSKHPLPSMGCEGMAKNMSDDSNTTQVLLGHERPVFLISLGVLGMLGCLALIGGCIIAEFYVPNYNWVTDTISDLAAGEKGLIMDVALYGFATGLFAIALAASHAFIGKKSWSFGILSLSTLAALVIIVAARNEYGDNDSEGIVIHMYLVYGIGILFLTTPLCIAYGLSNAYKKIKWMLVASAIVWGIVAPVFLFVPTDIDGLFERVLGLIACTIVGVLSYLFIKHGYHALKPDS